MKAHERSRGTVPGMRVKLVLRQSQDQSIRRETGGECQESRVGDGHKSARNKCQEKGQESGHSGKERKLRVPGNADEIRVPE